jgi:hypothetical protein
MNEKLNKILIGLIVVALAAAAVLVLNRFIGSDKLNEKIPAYEMQETPQPKETTLFFAGDIMLSRNVAARTYAANVMTQRSPSSNLRTSLPELT